MENVVATTAPVTTKKVTKKAVIGKATDAVTTKDLSDLRKVTVEGDAEQNTKLSQAAFLTLCFLNYDQKPTRNEEDNEFIENTHIVITDKVREELIRKGVCEVIDDKLTVTKFGTKWALKSQAFGQNFDSLIKESSFGAKIKLLFQVVNNLDESIKDKIRVIGKDGKPSQLWNGLDQLIERMDNWLEAKK